VQLFGAPVNFVTAPGWLMVWGWGSYLMLVIAFFKEPRRPSVLLPAISTEPSSEKKSGKLKRCQLLVERSKDSHFTQFYVHNIHQPFFNDSGCIFHQENKLDSTCRQKQHIF